MQEPQRPYVILAAVVFDETGECALHEAVRIAGRLPGAELHIVHVPPSVLSAPSSDPQALGNLFTQSPATLESWVQRACAGTSLTVRGHIQQGDPVEIILRTAGAIDTDLLVLGSHRRRGLEKLVLGSIAGRVLREALCPVLVAMPKAWEAPRDESADPPCPDCLNVRRETQDPARWCERHSRPHLRPHIYRPSDRPPSVLGS